MLLITQQQALDRWDKIPQEMKNALCSESNSEIIRRIYESEHISKEKAAPIYRIAGYVLAGFLHPEDVPKEIQEALGIDRQIAKTVADSLNRRIFDPIKADLDKVYAPAPLEPAKVLEELGIPVPKSVEEIRKPETAGPLAAEKKTIPAPKLEPVKIKDITPSPSQVPLGNLGGQVPPAPPERSVAPGAAPFLIHKEAEFQPLRTPPKIKIETGGEDLTKIPTPKETTFVKPARIEIGTADAGAPKSAMARSEISPPRIVHYSTYRSPVTPPSPAAANKETLAPLSSQGTLGNLGGPAQFTSKTGAMPPPKILTQMYADEGRINADTTTQINLPAQAGADQGQVSADDILARKVVRPSPTSAQLRQMIRKDFLNAQTGADSVPALADTPYQNSHVAASEVSHQRAVTAGQTPRPSSRPTTAEVRPPTIRTMQTNADLPSQISGRNLDGQVPKSASERMIDITKL